MKYLPFIVIILTPFLSFGQYNKPLPQQSSFYTFKNFSADSAQGLVQTCGLPNKNIIKYRLRKNDDQWGIDTCANKLWYYYHRGDSVSYAAQGGSSGTGGNPNTNLGGAFRIGAGANNLKSLRGGFGFHYDTLTNGEIRGTVDTGFGGVLPEAGTVIANAFYAALPGGGHGYILPDMQYVWGNGNNIKANGFVTYYSPDGQISTDTATGLKGYNLDAQKGSITFNSRVRFLDSLGMAYYQEKDSVTKRVGSGGSGSADLSNYYTKQQSDSKYQPLDSVRPVAFMASIKTNHRYATSPYTQTAPIAFSFNPDSVKLDGDYRVTIIASSDSIAGIYDTSKFVVDKNYYPQTNKINDFVFRYWSDGKMHVSISTRGRNIPNLIYSAPGQVTFQTPAGYMWREWTVSNTTGDYTTVYAGTAIGLGDIISARLIPPGDNVIQTLVKFDAATVVYLTMPSGAGFTVNDTRYNQ